MDMADVEDFPELVLEEQKAFINDSSVDNPHDKLSAEDPRSEENWHFLTLPKLRDKQILLI